MKKLVECVPNISEGRDQGVIDAVTAVIGEVDGVHLLDVDPGADTNRTVITFIGSPGGVAERGVVLEPTAGAVETDEQFVGPLVEWVFLDEIIEQSPGFIGFVGVDGEFGCADAYLS